MKTKSRILIIGIIIISVIHGCSTLRGSKKAFDGSKIDTSKLTKLYESDVDFIETIEKIVQRDSSTILVNEIPRSRPDLEKMRTVVKTFNGDTKAGITVPGFGGVKLGKDETSLNVYYIETKVVDNINDSVVYGCGYSVHYLFKKVKRGLDLSDLPTISASVHIDNSKTQVFYSLQTYGIISQNLTKYFKPTVNKKFDVEGFGIMQSSIDGIHNILGDTTLSKAVKFTPEILKFVKPYELEQI